MRFLTQLLWPEGLKLFPLAYLCKRVFINIYLFGGYEYILISIEYFLLFYFPRLDLFVMTNVKFGNSFGDVRLEQRCAAILDSMLNHKTAVLNRISTDRSNYVGNCGFMKKEKVDYRKILSPIVEQVSEIS
jgi:hypothetical protein